MERTLQNLYRILVVDHEPENVRRLTDWLREDSFVVSTACDGPQALEMARRETPDLILLDRALPSLSGEAVARELKKDCHLGMIPIIMLTNGGGLPGAAEMLEHGADDLISDPTNIHEVRSRIRTMLKKRDVYLQLEQANQELKEATPACSSSWSTMRRPRFATTGHSTSGSRRSFAGRAATANTSRL